MRFQKPQKIYDRKMDIKTGRMVAILDASVRSYRRFNSRLDIISGRSVILLKEERNDACKVCPRCAADTRKGAAGTAPLVMQTPTP